MLLTDEEEAMLRGERGETVREAIALQLEVAKFYDAKCFVPVTNVHMMGDIEVMGDAGLRYLKDEVALGARCVRTTTGSRDSQEVVALT